MTQSVLVWDFPTRAFHWLLVVAISFQYATAELMDDAIQLHFYGGYCTLGLIIFRLMWGIWGAYHARFINFIVNPFTAIAYAKSLPSSHIEPHDGHNPMGAYSIIFVLAVIATQAISGLFISDDIFSQGPYYSAVSSSTQDIANYLHHHLFNAIWVFLVLHIGAILFYKYVKKQGLVKAMITGYKVVAENDQSDRPIILHYWLRFILTAAVSAAMVYLLVVVLAPDMVDDFYY